LQLYWLQQGWGAPVHRGYLGVDGFFILSGLVLAIAHPTLGTNWTAAGGFWLRRFLRLYPTHLAVLSAFAVLLWAAGLFGLAPRDRLHFGADELWRHLLLVHGWGLSTRWAWNYPSWSVSTEWAGYLLFPLLWAGVRQFSGGAVAALAAAAFAVLACVGAWFGDLNLTFHDALGRFFPEFIAGMALARLNPRVPLPVAVVFLLTAILWLPDAAVALGFWLLLAALLRAGQAGQVWLGRVPGLRWLGEISYTFYMSFALSELVLASVFRAAGASPVSAAPLYALALTAMTLAFAVLLSYTVERPALRLAPCVWRLPLWRRCD
jgi:peptidoglycan/LPS O-acetylase OafA/YrhL